MIKPTPKVENYISTMLASLNTAKKVMEDRDLYPLQTKADLSAGIIRTKSGIVQKLSDVKPRILLDGYEKQFLSTFITLINKCLENPANPFLSFVFRTLMEMGITRANALFSVGVDDALKRQIKVLSVLVDYFYIPEKWAQDWFNELYSSEKKIFTDYEQKKIESFEKTTKGVKDFRQFCDSKIKSAHSKVMSGATYFNSDKFRSLYGAYSHLMHGNVFQLEVSLKPDNLERVSVHGYMFVVSSGSNFVQRLSEHLQDPGLSVKVSDMTRDLPDVWGELGEMLKSVQVRVENPSWMKM